MEEKLALHHAPAQEFYIIRLREGRLLSSSSSKKVYKTVLYIFLKMLIRVKKHWRSGFRSILDFPY
tara:strand:+ start:805 stop:1002 length:198 start_codon:yes stop_codon:yes gene_type:complete